MLAIYAETPKKQVPVRMKSVIAAFLAARGG